MFSKPARNSAIRGHSKIRSCIRWLFGDSPLMKHINLVLTACLIAALVEISRLHHSPIEDAFRLTLAGRLLLGRIFALSDIAAYWIAIMATAAIDRSTAPASTGV